LQLDDTDSGGNMFGVLLESRARRSRRTGGVALSAAVHLTIIAVATIAKAQGRMAAAAPVEVVKIAFIPPPTRANTPLERPVARVTTSATRHFNPTTVVVRHIDIPTTIPMAIPTADYAGGLSSDSIVIGSSRGSGGHPGGVLDLDDRSGTGELRGNELLMAVLTPAKPRYPEALRQTGVDGRVLVRFTVDTTGRVNMSTVQILESTHELFTQAVREALKAFRFKATVVQGRKIESPAEMPFEFSIRK
jgi:TonB family protein